jgi:hypothetical protein
MRVVELNDGGGRGCDRLVTDPIDPPPAETPLSIMIDASHRNTILTEAEFATLLVDLRRGDERAWHKTVEALRPLLKELARRQLPAQITHRADSSDVVQQTLGEAVQSLADFQGLSLGEFVVWLKQMLRHDACDAVR